MKRLMIGLALVTMVVAGGCAYIKDLWEGIDCPPPTPTSTVTTNPSSAAQIPTIICVNLVGG